MTAGTVPSSAWKRYNWRLIWLSLLYCLFLLPAVYGFKHQLIPDGVKMAVNYGFDRIRFLAPVRSSKRLRGRFTLDSIDEKAPGQWLLRHTVTVEIENEDKPALTAVWLGLMFVQGD